jgi:hypothetical protein
LGLNPIDTKIAATEVPVADVLVTLTVLALVVYIWVVQPIRWFRSHHRGHFRQRW